MTRLVEFLVAGSPNDAFLSQMAALRRSILAQRWDRWRPEIRCFLGGTVDWPAMEHWRPFLADVDIELVSSARFEVDGVFAQSERRLAAASRDADMHVLLDADTWVVGGLEDLLDDLSERDCVGGCIAHYGFPTEAGVATVDDWSALAARFGLDPLAFDHDYALVDGNAPDRARKTPFYVNAGVILANRPITTILADYLPMRRALGGLMARPYFAGQVALALAIAATRTATVALPLRFNLPNDAHAAARYPGEVEHARIIHYLRTDRFDRHEIFATGEGYRRFLGLQLDGIDAVLQRSVASVLGTSYPF